MNYKKVVIKVGTSTLTYENSKLNLRLIEKLAKVITNLRNQDIDVVLVTSGAVAVGSNRLGLTDRPTDVEGKQAVSAVGQGVLMQIYEKIFMEYNQIVAQLLLTKDVLVRDELRINAKNTLDKLFKFKVIPIVNENDTVSIEELGFSDNDTLSAYVATLVESDLLIILSDIDGLYDKDPNKFSDATIIEEVKQIDDYIRTIATGSASKVGTGGMFTKIQAVEIAGEKRIPTVITSGKNPEVIYDILEGKKVGTKFL